MTRSRGIQLLAVAGLLLALVACSSSSNTSGSGGGSLTSLYVDPAKGLDSDPGTLASPLKTIGKAVTLAKSGDTIVLMAGTYDEVSGESWGYALPTGVTLKGNTAGVVLQSNSSAKAFTSTGDATLTGVTLKAFGTAVVASAGTVTLTNDTLTGNSIGVALSNTAKAVLKTTSFTGSGGGLSLQDAASATMTGGTIDGIDQDAFDLSGSAHLALSSVQVMHTRSEVVSLRQASTATLTNCVIVDSSPQGAGSGASIDLAESSSVSLVNSTVTGAYSLGILARDASTQVKIQGGNVSSDGDEGIDAAGTVTINGGSFEDNTYYGIYLAGGNADITGATVSYNQEFGIAAEAGSRLKLRDTTMIGNTAGAVVLSGASGSADLGTASDPGGNTFQGTSGGFVGLTSNWTNATVQAVGDTWIASVEGADASGHYSNGLASGPATGQNYELVAGASLML